MIHIFILHRAKDDYTEFGPWRKKKIQPHEILEKAEEIKHWIDPYERMPEGLEKEKEWDRISIAQSKLLEDAQERGLFVPFFNKELKKIVSFCYS